MSNPFHLRGNSKARSLRIMCIPLLFAAIASAWAQSTPKSPGQPGSEKKATTASVETKSVEPPGVLIQLNGALETLAAKVSPAVVQILVTGYGPLRE